MQIVKISFSLFTITLIFVGYYYKIFFFKKTFQIYNNKIKNRTLLSYNKGVENLKKHRCNAQ
ncbi:hypothetical protein GCM10022271_16760 [Corallibacter vietnamensis]|uniref:Uncharacterized protein n=1 Tax=Corallibacter vietnamensis TaxID=904130 RepID=A0ABP7H843_9FLAO